jgi:hypothetical protein
VAVPVILNYVWLSDIAELVIRWARWPALFVAARHEFRVGSELPYAGRLESLDGG